MTGDLKPKKVMIDSNKTAVLIDFDRILNENEIHNDKTIDFVSEANIQINLQINLTYIQLENSSNIL